MDVPSGDQDQPSLESGPPLLTASPEEDPEVEFQNQSVLTEQSVQIPPGIEEGGWAALNREIGNSRPFQDEEELTETI